MVTNLLKHSQKLFERQQNSILSAAAIITAAVFLSALLGLIRNRLLVAYFFHDPASLDAYWVAFRLPDLVFQLLVLGALSAAFIPVFSKYIAKNHQESIDVANSMINIIILLFALLSLIIFIFAEPLNRLFTGENFTPEQLALASKYTRIMLFAQFFFAISNFMTGIIQAHHRFLVPALSPLAYNLGIIAGIIILGPKFGVYGAAVGVVLGAFLHLASQLPLAIKLGFSYRPIILFDHPGVREIVRLMLPRTLALSVNQLEIFVLTFLATTIPYTGALTIVTLAQQLMSLPNSIFCMTICQDSLPFLSKESSSANLDQFKSTFTHSLHQILFFAMPATAVLIVLRIPAVRLAFGAKAFPWQATLITGKTVAFLALGIFAHSSVQLLTRAYYALHNTKTPLLAAVLSVTTNISLSYYLVHFTRLGIYSLAIGTSIAALIHFSVLLIGLSRRLQLVSFSLFFLPPIKIALASFFTGLFLWLPLRFLDQFVFDTTRTVNLILLTLVVSTIGSIVYLSLCKLFRIHQLDSVVKLLHRLGNWHKVLSSSGETIEPTPTSSITP